MQKVCVFALLLATRLAFADPVSLVADLSPGAPSLTDAEVSQIVAVGSSLFFVAKDPRNGNELWMSDGTDVGTVLVRDLTPGVANSDVRFLTAFAGAAYFVTNDPVLGESLWKTDGSVFGTTLVKDLEPGSTGGTISSVFVLGPTLYFVANTADEGVELWQSDGSTAGTFVVPVMPGPTGSDVASLTAVGSQLYFVATGAGGREVYLLGPSGPTELPVVSGATGSAPSQLTAFGTRLVFVAVDGVPDAELWSSLAGAAPQRVADLNPSGSSDPVALKVIGDSLYFGAIGPNGREVWRWDGNGAPGEVTTLAGGALLVNGIVGVTGQIYFLEQSTAFDLFGSAGSTGAPGQTKLSSAAQFGANLRISQVGDRALANIDRNLWISDGVTAAMFELTPGLSDPTFCGVHGDVMYFVEESSAGLYVTDGSLVTPPVFFGFGSCANAELGGAVYFGAGAASLGERQLYKRDGSMTTLVKEIAVSPPSTSPNAVGVVGGTSFFVTNGQLVAVGAMGATVIDLAPGVVDSVDTLLSSGDVIFAGGSSGSTNGTFILDSASAAPATFISDFRASESGQAFDGRMYVRSTDATLWDITGVVATSHPLPEEYPDELTLAGGALYFTLNPEGSGSLWRVQPGGTIAEVGTYTGVSQLASDGATLYFIRGNELHALPQGGSPALVFDAGTMGCSLTGVLQTAGARVYFPVTCSASGTELWVSNGTTPGTFSLGDLWSGAPDGFSGMVASLGDTLFFSGRTEASGAELWKTDGTALGTVMVKDILPGFAGSTPSAGVAAAGVVWFAASDATHGYELWRSDGSATGTVLASDLEPGVASSSPDRLTAGNGGLLFMAATSSTGREPYFVGPFAHLSVTATGSTPTPVTGAPFTITATVTNDGPGTAEDVDLAVDVPAGLTVSLTSPSQGTCDVLGCAFGSVASGAFVTVEYTLVPLAPGVHTTSFSVVSSTADLLPAPADATVSVTAGTAADLSVQASVMPVSVVVGEAATITATLVNNGPSAASGVTIDVVASGAATIASATLGASACSIGAAGVTCNSATLASGATVTATIVVSPAAAGTLTGSATVSALDADPVPSNNTASVSLTVTAPMGTTGPVAMSGETETPETPETPEEAPAAQKQGCACREGSSPEPLVLLLSAAWLLRLKRRRDARRR